MSSIKMLAKSTAVVLTLTALAFAFLTMTAVSSLQITMLPDVYAQASQQGESNIATKAARMSAAVDGILRYYANSTGAQYTEVERYQIPEANISSIEDVTIPSVPITIDRNTTGIVSMADYLIARGLLDKSYELFIDVARDMRNVTFEDVNELQTSLLQLNSLIESRAPYTLAEDVVQNLQAHLQRTLASTEEFTSATTTSNATNGFGNTTTSVTTSMSSNASATGAQTNNDASSISNSGGTIP